jgi:hypothetical protein
MKETGYMDDVIVAPKTEEPAVVRREEPAPLRGSNRAAIVLSLITLAAMWFLSGSVFPYLTTDISRYGIYAPRRDWLLVHMVSGAAALLIGPLQFWLGLTRSHMMLHRILGIAYVMSVGISTPAAFYLAYKNDFGWVYGMGLSGLGVAWILTTGLAVAAICNNMVEQHWEWMIRSYVVTFAFVVMRLTAEILATANIGNTAEQLTAASWLCWSVPLLINEAILQGRKIFR